jgi:hypothetical protein
LTGEVQIAYASGAKAAATTECATWSAPRGAAFTSYGICLVNETGAGVSSVSLSCTAEKEDGLVSNCWGLLTGTQGKHNGRTGTVSWRNEQSADRKSTKASGTGIWNE